MDELEVKKQHAPTGWAFTIVILLTSLFAAFELKLLDDWNEQALDLVSRTNLESQITHQMRDIVRKRALSIERLLRLQDPFDRDEEAMRFASYAREFLVEREKIVPLLTSPVLRDAYERVWEATRAAQPLNDKLVNGVMNEQLSPSEIKELVEAGETAREAQIQSWDKLVELFRQSHTEAISNYRQSRRYFFALTIALFSVSILATFFVVSRNTLRLKKLSHYSVADSLTGLYNRRWLDAMLEKEWSHSIREKCALSVVMVDIDHFKYYNDHFGHQAGDACLRAVAGILANQIKRGSDFVARYGGEEFCVVLPNTTLENARFVAENLRVAVERAKIKSPSNAENRWVTISLGIATMLPESPQTVKTLISRADQALYQSKQQGRNRSVEATSTDSTASAPNNTKSS